MAAQASATAGMPRSTRPSGVMAWSFEAHGFERDMRAFKRVGMHGDIGEADARARGLRAAFQIARTGAAHRADAIVEDLGVHAREHAPA